MLQIFLATTSVVRLYSSVEVAIVSITAVPNNRATSQLYPLAGKSNCILCKHFVFFAGLSQCYTVADCTGEEVAAADQRDCCVGTNDGLSYNDGTTCNRCIGMLVKMCSN